MVISKKTIIFQDPVGVQHFPGRVQLLIPIETCRTCDFPGGPDPLTPRPSLDPT